MGRMFDIIKSIYSTVKSQLKHNNTLSEYRRASRECLSSFRFSMYLNDLEAETRHKMGGGKWILEC